MSEKDLYDETNEYIARVNKIRDAYSASRQAIRDDKNLSQRGKAKKLEDHDESYQAKYDTSMDEYNTWLEQTKKEVIREIYSHPIHSVSGAEKMRPLFEEAERAYREGAKEIEGLAERAVRSGHRGQVRALAATAYARRDWPTLRGLREYDVAVGRVLDYEEIFGDLASVKTKVQLNIDLRPPTKHE